MDRVFKPGDRVEFCDLFATVKQNCGTYGWVHPDGEDIIVRWAWVFEGTAVTLVGKE